MRGTIIFLLLSLIPHAYGQQPDITRNRPRPDDKIRFVDLMFTDTVSAGADCMWNLADTELNAAVDLTIESVADSAGIIGCKFDRTMYYFQQSGDTLLYTGFENSQSDMHYDLPEIVLQLPILPGTSHSGRFNGDGRYCDRWHHDMSGSYHTDADATGTLITPERDTINDIVRLHTVRIIDSRYYLSPNKKSDRLVDSLRLIQDERRWYAPGYRYPVLIESTLFAADGKSVRSHKTYYSPLEMVVGTVEDPENAALRGAIIAQKRNHEADNKTKSGIIDYTFTQHRETENISVTFRTSESADIEIVVSNIAGIVYETERFRAKAGEEYKKTINYGRLPYSAVYGLHINCGAEQYSEKFYR